MKIITRIFLSSLIIIKIILGSVFIYQVEFDPLFLESAAIASKPPEDPKSAEKAAPKLPAAALAQTKQTDLQGGKVEEQKEVAREEEFDLEFLVKKEAEIREKEAELKIKSTRLMAIQQEINKKIAILTQLRNDIRAQMAEKKAIKEKQLALKKEQAAKEQTLKEEQAATEKALKEKNFKRLIKTYSSMKPQKVASLIEKLNLKFAIKLLSNMKADIVGPILSFLDLEKAAKITEGIAK